MPTDPAFQGASVGTAVSFSPIPLPAGPGIIKSGTGVVRTTDASPWRPTREQLLNGNTVIQTEAQMIDVWGQLFSEPFNPTVFESPRHSWC
jgi:hypothetical protein